ncbi:transcriptional repressor [Parapedobacter koreensis]|uniref:Ferric uptake regulator family protein n=1 Tax=Parapedobacter koreensis TaxID=332977 RepID=A0A1H7JS56_9SPHI|nr:transcriptional repressor [Parapedobacter koreensis]SEK76800.1 Ferric uptake regulator family protein [Parapedobacter koreensis]
MGRKRLSQIILTRLADGGYVISQQRRVLIEEVCKAQAIPDVEAFWIQLRSRHPISWSTVYNGLKLLAQLGLLERKAAGTRNQAYRLAPGLLPEV